MRILVHLTTEVENPTRAASAMSAVARGLLPVHLHSLGLTPAPPNTLVELLVAADRSLTY